MRSKKQTSARRVTKQSEEAGHAQLPPVEDPARTSSHPSSSLSSSSSLPSAARQTAVAVVAAVGTATEPTRRVTRSQSKALHVPTTVSTVRNPSQTRKPRARKVDSSSALPAEARGVKSTSRRETTTLPQKQPLPLVRERSSSPKTAITDPLQPISAWAAGIEGEPTSQTSPYNSSTAEQVGFWKSLGYDLADTTSASMSSSVNDSQTTESRATSTTPKTKPAKAGKDVTTVNANDGRFSAVLMEYNINISPEQSPDERLAELKKLVLQKYPRDRTARGTDIPSSENRWRRDMSKCKVSNEAIFQRTIMMDIIDRDDLDETLDFMCEAQWVADRMPRRNKALKLAQPKPDLAVAFKTASLLPPNASLPSIMRLGDICAHIFAEGLKRGEMDRTFHFLSIEVKGKAGRIGNTEAEYQNLNTASQALHNIYLLMRSAKQEDVFFDKVRFFSVVATAASFEVRVHRGTRLEPDDYIDPTYKMRFCFDEVLSIGADYTKAIASKIVYNILYHYGVAQLRPVLRKAVEIVLKQRRGMGAEAAEGSQLGESRATGEEAGAAQQLSPATGKRSGDDDLAESFGSHASHQRRRLGGLVMNDA